MDENEADIYYIDTRNADPRYTSFQPRPTIVRQPGGHGTRTTYVPHNRPAQYGQPMTQYYNPGPFPPNMQPMIYAPAGGALASIFGRLSTGDVINMVAQAFAVLQPLPAAPVAQGDSNLDAGNAIKYQEALAEYTKRDEQVRTIGSLVGKLLG